MDQALSNNLLGINILIVVFISVIFSPLSFCFGRQ